MILAKYFDLYINTRTDKRKRRIGSNFNTLCYVSVILACITIF